MKIKNNGLIIRWSLVRAQVGPQETKPFKKLKGFFLFPDTPKSFF